MVTIISVSAGLLLLITSNIVLGSCNAWIAGYFDITVCRRGVIKGLIIAACIIMAYVAGYLNPDVSITINDGTMTLTAAINTVMIAAFVAYAIKFVYALYKLFKLDTSGISVPETIENNISENAGSGTISSENTIEDSSGNTTE